MEGSEHEADVEALLDAARPAPSLVFSSALERSLFPERRPLRARRPLIAFATASALAVVFLVVSLVGGGPLAPHGGAPSTAGQHCTTVFVTRVAPVGQVVRRADGVVTVETARKPVSRAEQRCR